MKYTKINGRNFYNMVIHGSNKLEEQSDYVNALNVFPVPDGDTGTNMSMTFKAAAKSIEAKQSDSVGEVSKTLAKGALMGARGNSGVILSQIFRGISRGLEGKEEVDTNEFALALREGCNSAYKAVMRPTEGTILTIIRAAADSAEDYVSKNDNNDFEPFLDHICKESKIMLDKTPDMLPALKQAKVVDSGGTGLLIILQGMHEALVENIDAEIKDFVSKGEGKVTAASDDPNREIKFGYCTEFIILGGAEKALSFKSEIESLGDSMIVVGDEDIDVIKVHIHTNDPGLVLSKAVKLGELSKIKIDNMREEHRELIGNKEGQDIEDVALSEAEPMKKYGIISVAMGEGIKNIFEDMNVDYVIEGGQTMNPSTEDIMKCVDKINAEHIFILPNNKNIIMAANQASDISDKNVIVIPTKNIPQGISCVTMFNPNAEVEENVEALTEAMEAVKDGSITYAVRDTEIDDIQIKEGNILGLEEGKIKHVGTDVYETTSQILEDLVDEDSELITLFYGSDCNEEEVNEFVSKLEEKYEDLDIQCYAGKQPLYYFIISVE